MAYALSQHIMGDVILRLYHEAGPRSAASLPLPAAARRWAVDADLADKHVAGVIHWLVIGVAVVTFAALVSSGWWVLAAAPVVLLVPGAVIVRCSGRRERRLVAALPDLIDLLGRALRSGASFSQALQEASVDSPPAVASELFRLVAEIELGQTSRQALHAWAARTSAAEIRIVAAALAVASENEAGMSLALAGVSQSLRDRRALRAEIRSHTAQASASMQAMVLLPIGLLMLDVLGDGGRLRYLTGTGLGQGCLASSLVLTAAGWLWMQSIVRRRLPT